MRAEIESECGGEGTPYRGLSFGVITEIEQANAVSKRLRSAIVHFGNLSRSC